MNFLSSSTPPLNRPSGVDWRGGKKRVQECREKKSSGQSESIFLNHFFKRRFGGSEREPKKRFLYVLLYSLFEDGQCHFTAEGAYTKYLR